ncbi:MAG: hypothetical protein KME35_05810 [Aphanocapsa sp. GSE-SYN-MK-11-07L]|jgi:hypothetical protein|nr:hypothetical protein [Aphanocapsa sp. GSE-SYN-MK-11-07L]
MLKSVTFFGSAVVMAIAFAQPTYAQTQPSSLPPDTLVNLVTQISDMLANTLSSGSCQDFSNILTKVPTGGGTAPDPNSMIGQVLLSVQKDPKLKSIVVSKVGPSLVTKLIDCNMVPLDALSPTAPSSTSTPSPTTSPSNSK